MEIKPETLVWIRQSVVDEFIPQMEEMRKFKEGIDIKHMLGIIPDILDIDSEFNYKKRWEYSWALSFLKIEPSDILLIGEDYSPFLLTIKDLGHEVTVVGSSNYSIVNDLGDMEFDFAEKLRNKGINFRGNGGNDIPFEDNKFDIVYMLDILNHTKKFRNTVKEMLRVVKPGGPAIITLEGNNEMDWLVPEEEPPEDVIRSWAGRPLMGAVFRKTKTVEGFSYRIERDGDGFHAFVPQLKGCHVGGATKKEAIKNLEDAVNLYMGAKK